MQIAVPVEPPAPFPHHLVPAGMAAACFVLALVVQGECVAGPCGQAHFVARVLQILGIGFAGLACFVYVQYRRALIARATHVTLMPPPPPY